MDLVRTLGQPLIDTLCRLSDALQRADVPFAVIGASALLLHDVDVGRTTRDLDLAVAVEGGMEAIRPLLLGAGLASTSIEHRFKTEDGSEIDVLAVDPAWTPTHEIRLADGGRIHAVGLPDALQRPIKIAVDGCQVLVAPLSLLIATKLHAATLDDRPHDLADACAALLGYERSGDRRFAVDYERFAELDYETSGAFLAGTDTAEIASRQTRYLVDLGIGELLTSARLTGRFSKGPMSKRLLLAYREGLHAQQNEPDATV
ncbi:nucleotidyl transferase AbiEii/AbiGii toxin family protein [Candidatus Bipolaricaulota bacterium]|nr:nucleotidyl transferase AbiEii/AbiGii toxin family protein [Candidatus Bipolaricaulota bacterium]